jgi:uncharacterized glyoxalase superfamily protein PhnB
MAHDPASEPPGLGSHGGHEIYPMPTFVALETVDVERLSTWYREALGFSVVFAVPGISGGAPSLVHLRRGKYQDVLIRAAATGAPGTAVCLQAYGDVDEIATKAAAALAFGAARVEPPADRPWNTRDVRVIDPDGRTIVFSAPRFDPEATERMRRMFEGGGGGP